jgi:hypothetical protein
VKSRIGRRVPLGRLAVPAGGRVTVPLGRLAVRARG